jgi:hypothetical protein
MLQAEPIASNFASCRTLQVECLAVRFHLTRDETVQIKHEKMLLACIIIWFVYYFVMFI